MKRIFSIEWPEDAGSMWMNVDNLESCLFSSKHIGEKMVSKVKVKDIAKDTLTQHEVDELDKKLQQTHNRLKKIFRLEPDDT